MPGLFSTQSVHKQGAGFSQASQIHKRDEHIRGQRRYIEHKRFNESFLMHASTSPFYPLFASLDVNAKVHEGKAGEALWDRCIELGIEARKKLRQFGGSMRRRAARAEEKWFFDPFVPDVVTIRDSKFTKDVTESAGRICPPRSSSANSSAGISIRTSAWHGYAGIRRRLRDGGSEQADAAHARHQSSHRRVSGLRRARDGASPTISANSASCRRSAT